MMPFLDYNVHTAQYTTRYCLLRTLHRLCSRCSLLRSLHMLWSQIIIQLTQFCLITVQLVHSCWMTVWSRNS